MGRAFVAIERGRELADDARATVSKQLALQARWCDRRCSCRCTGRLRALSRAASLSLGPLSLSALFLLGAGGGCVFAASAPTWVGAARAVGRRGASRGSDARGTRRTPSSANSVFGITRSRAAIPTPKLFSALGRHSQWSARHTSIARTMTRQPRQRRGFASVVR